MKNREKIVEAIDRLEYAVRKLREAIECDHEVDKKGTQESTPPGNPSPNPPGSGG